MDAINMLEKDLADIEQRSAAPIKMRPKPWEREPRAWKWAVASSCLAGVLFVIATLSTELAPSNELGIAAMCALVFVNALAPVFTTLRASRFYFWYGLLPAFLFLPWIASAVLMNLTLDYARHAGAALRPIMWFDRSLILLTTGSILMSSFLLGLLVSTPISIFRFARQTSKRRAEVGEAKLNAAREAEFGEAWPPKPVADVRVESETIL